MANPTNTTRGTPGTSLSSNGRYLHDGHSTKLAFSRRANVALWEIEVTAPGVDNLDKIPTATMFNTRWRTFRPRQLITLTPASARCAYDPAVYEEVVDFLIGQEGSVTVQFPDTSDLDLYAYLKSFLPDGKTEGNMPTANIVVEPTNWDPTNRVEAGPVMTEVLGT